MYSYLLDTTLAGRVAEGRWMYPRLTATADHRQFKTTSKAESTFYDKLGCVKLMELLK
jgi:hypothetical protein